MYGSHRTVCVGAQGRLSNEELCALMTGLVRREKGSAQRLFLAVAPLLVAFHGGQVQAGQAQSDELEALVQQSLAAVYRARTSYVPGQLPFRAWLLAIARSSAAGRSRAHDRVKADAVTQEARMADAFRAAGVHPMKVLAGAA